MVFFYVRLTVFSALSGTMAKWRGVLNEKQLGIAMADNIYIGVLHISGK